MNTKLKRHLLSALNTFIPAFFLAIFSMPLDLENLDKATLIALALVGLRAWVKAIQQTIVSKYSK